MEKTSQVSGYYKLKREERLAKVKEFASLTDEEAKILEAGLPFEQAEKMVENVVATYRLPLGIAVNFLINGKEYMVPMSTMVIALLGIITEFAPGTGLNKLSS